MLIEFRIKRLGTNPNSQDLIDAPAFILLNQIVGVTEDISVDQEDDTQTRVVTRLLLLSGPTVDVEDSVSDVLDALKFVTRHIAAGPGLVDRTTGDNEELYPWRRCEKVSVLAEKWRAHEKTPRQSGVPVYGPKEPDVTRDEHGGHVVDVPVPPAPPPADNVTDDPLMHGYAAVTVTGAVLFPAGNTPEKAQAAFASLMGHLKDDPRGTAALPPEADKAVGKDPNYQADFGTFNKNPDPKWEEALGAIPTPKKPKETNGNQDKGD